MRKSIFATCIGVCMHVHTFTVCSISHVSSYTCAVIRAISVGTGCVVMAIMGFSLTFIDIYKHKKEIRAMYKLSNRFIQGARLQELLVQLVYLHRHCYWWLLQTHHGGSHRWNHHQCCYTIQSSCPGSVHTHQYLDTTVTVELQFYRHKQFAAENSINHHMWRIHAHTTAV